MKSPTLALFMLVSLPLSAQEPKVVAENAARLQEGAKKVADDQDELAADAQQLTIEQTVPEVIKLLDEVQDLMSEVTDSLSKENTGGDTMAAQTQVIEKIHQAAQKRQQQGGGDAGSAMLDMMERMMGKEPQKMEDAKKGEEPGEKAGQGNKGLSDAANSTNDGTLSDEKSEQRRVPKAAGSAGSPLPQEFQKAMDAYNKGAARTGK